MAQIRTRGIKALFPVVFLVASVATAAENPEVDLAASVIRSESCGGYNPLNDSEAELNKAAIINSRMRLQYLMLQESTDRELKICYALRVLESQIEADRVRIKSGETNRCGILLQKRQAELARQFREIQNPKAKPGGPVIESKPVRVSKEAALMGHFLVKKDPQAVRPILVKLMSDPDMQVKLRTTIHFADRKDPVCARTLLEFLKNTSMKKHEKIKAVMAIMDLTGTNFGYSVGSDEWKPTTENNQRAIRRFEEWINKHVGKKAKNIKIPIHATLELHPDKPGWLVLEMTNTSTKPVRFWDIREGDGGCGDLYEVTIEKDGKAYSSNGSCFYAPFGVPKIVELAPKQTYRRKIQPEAYILRPLSIPYEVRVTYRLTDKFKKKAKTRKSWKYKTDQKDQVDLDMTFQTTKAKFVGRKLK